MSVVGKKVRVVVYDYKIYLPDLIDESGVAGTREEAVKEMFEVLHVGEEDQPIGTEEDLQRYVEEYDGEYYIFRTEILAHRVEPER